MNHEAPKMTINISFNATDPDSILESLEEAKKSLIDSFNQSCGTCKFYQMLVRLENGAEAGKCRRNAPGIGVKFPNVSPDEWCGEYTSTGTGARQ